MVRNPFDTQLESDRLILDRIRMSDDSSMFEYTSNKDVTCHLSWSEHTNIDQTRNYIKLIIDLYNTSQISYTWAVRLKENQKLIGVVRIFDVSYPNKRGEISYILNPGYQGYGYMTEAIQAVIDLCAGIGINRIQAKCTVDNTASENAMKKIGMKYEGTLKSYWINKGVVKDAKMYSITIQKGN